MAKKVAKKTAKKLAPLVVWVARDADSHARYGLFLTEPVLCGAMYYWGNGGLSALVTDRCPKHFEPMMGITLKPGERRQFVWAGSPLKPLKRAK